MRSRNLRLIHRKEVKIKCLLGLMKFDFFFSALIFVVIVAWDIF